MQATTPLSYEDLLYTQIESLTSCQPKDFDRTFQELALQGIEWFKLDRITLFPNSMILLNDGKTISVSRQQFPKLNKSRFVIGNYLDYLKLLRSKQEYQIFDSEGLQNSKIQPLQELYNEGARWHGIVRLELFGQTWGALAFARFSEDEPELTEAEIKRLKLLCDTWLVYWQHSTVTRSLSNGTEELFDESEKLLKLSKKQCNVLSLLAQGFTAKQCAEKLFISPRTVESHKYRILDLLELETHTELVQFALRNGLGIEAV
jgi:DNA-binding CsgD family transcriptional regulator